MNLLTENVTKHIYNPIQNKFLTDFLIYFHFGILLADKR